MQVFASFTSDEHDTDVIGVFAEGTALSVLAYIASEHNQQQTFPATGRPFDVRRVNYIIVNYVCLSTCV